jgi:hypothetical protein
VWFCLRLCAEKQSEERFYTTNQARMLRRMCCGLYEVPLPKQRAESESGSDEEQLGLSSEKGTTMKKMQPVIVPPSPETASPDVLAQKQEQQQQQQKMLGQDKAEIGKWSPMQQTKEKGWGKIEEEPQQQQRAPAADAFMPVRTIKVTSPRPVTEDTSKQQLQQQEAEKYRGEAPPREARAAEGIAGTAVGAAAVGGREAEREAGPIEQQQQRRVGFEDEERRTEPSETAERESVGGIAAAGGAATETEAELYPFNLDHFINLVCQHRKYCTENTDMHVYCMLSCLCNVLNVRVLVHLSSVLDLQSLCSSPCLLKRCCSRWSRSSSSGVHITERFTLTMINRSGA